MFIEHITWGKALQRAIAQLQESSITYTPQLDAQVLLAHILGLSRATVLAYPERPLSQEQTKRYAAVIARRIAGEPVAYLTGTREFMGLAFHIDSRALIPRPETELLVEEALKEIRTRLTADTRIETTPRLADIGTGSGAIALSIAALEPRLTNIYATDISMDALALAKENAEQLGVADRITFLQGDLLSPLPEPVDVILANLPYVAPIDAQIPIDVAYYEPPQALYGEHDGLGHLRRFLSQAPAHIRPKGIIFLEFGYDQANAVRKLAETAFPHSTVEIHKDYAGWERFAVVRLVQST